MVSFTLTLYLLVLSSYAATINDLKVNIDQATKIVTLTGKIDSGSDRQVTVKVTDSTESNPKYINQTTSNSDGSFKFAYTMSDITEGTYKVTVGGEDVSTPVQTTFTYSDIKDSSITPASASFDKKTSMQTDITVNIIFNGNTLNVVKKGTTPLTANDYMLADNTLTIRKSYLASLPIGNTTLTFDFSNGVDTTFVVNVSDTTPFSSGGGSYVSVVLPSTNDAKSDKSQTDSKSSELVDMADQIFVQTSEESKKELVSKAIESIKQTDSTLMMNDAKKTVDTTLGILDAVIRINSMVNSPELIREAEGISNRVIEQLTTEKIESKDSKVVLGGEQADNLIEKINLAAEAVKIGEKLKELGINSSDERKIVLRVDTTNQKDVEVQFPVEILSKANSAGFERIEVSSPVASISIPPSAITTNDSEVSLSIKEVKSEELTAQQKAVVGSSTVFDFYAKTIGKTGEEQRISQFNGNLEITIPYEIKNEEDPDKVTIFFITDNGQLENRMGVYDPLTKAVKFTTDHFSKYVIKYNDIKFKDIEKVKSWAGKEIEAMAAKGIINGRKQEVFDPDATITRAEFITLITKSMKIIKSGLTTTFKDINKNDWYYDDVASAQKAGILKKADGKEFRPNDAITRADMAVFMARAMRIVKKINNDNIKLIYVVKLKDYKSIGVTKRKDIEYIVKNKVMQGMSDNVFEPQGKATRAQAAVVIYRMWMK